ncbi:LemA family protein [Tannerella sp.]|uniref:LemA family protein n=1 Tax=Tannerella sp. TaxID=2382127 RepID=UPI003FA1A826
MKRWGFISTLLLLSASLSVAQETLVHDVDITVRLDRSGTAHITEIWDVDVQTGTEWYLVQGNLGAIEIRDLAISDETGKTYLREDVWDTHRTIEAKAGRCGLIRISQRPDEKRPTLSFGDEKPSEMVKQYSEHEYQTLTDVISMRRDLEPTASAQDVEEQEGLIGKLVGRINMLSETYPNLKADRIYLSTMNDMKQYEENVRHSRMIYNDSVTRFNRAVRQMPNNLVAGMFGFRIREYLEEDAKKRNFPTV